MRPRRHALPAFGLSLLVMAPAFADVVTLSAVKDNTLYSEDENVSNGSGVYFFAGRTNIGNLRRGLLAFDIAAAVPAGSTIDSVSLQLYMSPTTEAGSEEVALHEVLEDWGEGASNASGQEGGGDSAENGDATWEYTFYSAADPPASPAWSSLGGEFSATASATTNVGDEGFYTWGSTAALVADVQAWLDTPTSNYGWIAIGDEGTNQTAKRFNSRQNNAASERPELTVNFTPPAGGSGACCFGDGTCTELSPAECGAQSGSYQGDGSDCTPNPCPQPGACCLPDGTCADILEADCLAQLGAFQGTGTTCATTNCVGACCLAAGVCVETTLDDCNTQSGTYQGFATTCTPNDCPVVLTPYLDPLPLPAVAQPVSGTVGGVATYDIPMLEFDQQLHSELPPTRVWGYSGTYPGPIIEAGSDLPVTVRWINDLRDEQGDLRTDHYLPVDLCPHGADLLPRTVVHLHGGHVPADVDGYPEDTFLPGQMAEYVYPNNQLPATLWFHDHALGVTRLNVYMGLAGFYLLRDAFELGLGLPEGEFEIPLVIQDRSFNSDGTWKYPATWQDHFFGDTILVNGKVWPYFEVKQGKYRFRLLNGSNSRVYTLALSTGDPFQQIGTDGGLLPAPVTVTEITLAGGERADVVMDFAGYAAGTEIILTNSAPAPYPGTPGVGVIPEIMKFVVLGAAGDTDPLPATLRPMDELLEQDAVQSRDFELRKVPDPCAGSVWLINDLLWDDITEFPVLDTIEIWRFINRSGVVHPMHMHLVLFQVLDRQDFDVVDGDIVPIGDPVPVADEEAGWKDTVKAQPNQITRVIARFEDYTGLFPYHCHILEHEDHEMMRQFMAVGCLADEDCDDGEFCNGPETCELATNTCDPGSPPDCDDGIVCTVDSCNETTDSCDHTSDDALCDDTLYCNGAETCDPLLDCQPGPDPCPDQPCDEVGDTCGGCDTYADCADFDEDGIRDDPCVWWECQSGTCVATEVRYADMGGEFGDCPPDGTADANDRFHSLNCFSNQTTAGSPGYPCESNPPFAYNVDAAKQDEPCTPDGVCDGNDAFAALNAFEGSTSCSCPLDGPAPIGGGDLAGFESTSDPEEVTIHLIPSATTAAPGDTVEVDVYFDPAPPDLRGYQLHLGVTGGRRGNLELIDITVHPRKDHAFVGLNHWEAFNVATAQMLAGLDGPGVDTADARYLATFTYRASRDAAGAFAVELMHDRSDPAQRTVLFPTPAHGAIDIVSARAAGVIIGQGNAHRRGKGISPAGDSRGLRRP